MYNTQAEATSCGKTVKFQDSLWCEVEMNIFKVWSSFYMGQLKGHITTRPSIWQIIQRGAMKCVANVFCVGLQRTE